MKARLFFALLGLTLMSTSCGSSSSPSATDPTPVGAESRHHPLQGTLTDNVSQLLANKGLESCDRQNATIKMKLARILDEREAEIRDLSSHRPMNLAKSRRFQLGPIPVRERTDQMPPRQGWYEWSYSWKDAFALYQKIRNLPIDLQWLQLNSDVRSLIADDQSRLIYGDNLSLAHDSGPRIAKLFDALTACLDHKDCLKPTLDDELLTFVHQVGLYSFYWKALDTDRAPAKKRDLLDQWFTDIMYDKGRFDFHYNSTVRRISPRTIQLPLIAGPFEGVQADLARIIEKVWTSPTLHVEIQWIKALPRFYPFQFVAEDTVGERSYVDPRDKTIHLYPEIYVTSIAHEIGHVLGFQDHYYSVWKPDTCAYVYQFDDTDLMSDGAYGEVNAEEWQELRSQYPLPRQ